MGGGVWGQVGEGWCFFLFVFSNVKKISDLLVIILVPWHSVYAVPSPINIIFKNKTKKCLFNMVKHGVNPVRSFYFSLSLIISKANQICPNSLNKKQHKLRPTYNQVRHLQHPERCVTNIY